jgi:hypothetical protein
MGAEDVPPEPAAQPRSRWQEVGLYDPDAPDAADRLALLEYLTERGATIPQMVEAHRLGSLPGVAGDLVIRRHHDMVPVSDVAAQSGLDLPRVLRALVAAGVPADSDTEVASDLAGLMVAFEQGAALMGDEAILAFTRVLGRAATSIAEAAIALFFAELGPAPSAPAKTSWPGPARPRRRPWPSCWCPTPWLGW